MIACHRETGVREFKSADSLAMHAVHITGERKYSHGAVATPKQILIPHLAQGHQINLIVLGIQHISDFLRALIVLPTWRKKNVPKEVSIPGEDIESRCRGD